MKPHLVGILNGESFPGFHKTFTNLQGRRIQKTIYENFCFRKNRRKKAVQDSEANL